MIIFLVYDMFVFSSKYVSHREKNHSALYHKHFPPFNHKNQMVDCIRWFCNYQITRFSSFRRRNSPSIHRSPHITCCVHVSIIHHKVKHWQDLSIQNLHVISINWFVHNATCYVFNVLLAVRQAKKQNSFCIVVSDSMNIHLI